MRWYEITERIQQALPLRANPNAALRKALPLIPPQQPQPDPVTKLAQGIAPVVQAVTQQAIAADDAEEQRIQQAAQAAQQPIRPTSTKEQARQQVKQQYGAT